MTIIRRGVVSVSREVSVSADDFWAILRDWPAIMKWHPPVTDPPFLGATLKAGHDARVLPCTRLLSFQDTPSVVSVVEETLLLADPETRRIYYTFDGFKDRMRNYLATTTVDEVAPDRAVVTCASSFDVTETASLEDLESLLSSIYADVVIRGIEAVAQREKEGRETTKSA